MKNNILNKILNHEALISKPPVLIDIGASGEIHAKWKGIAAHSICIAFDADLREMKHIENAQDGFKKLIVYPNIVSDQDVSEMDFHLTDSPFCSSTLVPDEKRIKNWAFSPLFKVKETVKKSTKNLNTILTEQDINYVDWFKTDSQGTDLRIFKNLQEKMIQNILIAEFEPGIIDAYIGEDKAHQLLAYMDTMPFWISQMNIKGSYRITNDTLSKYFNKYQKVFVQSILKQSPGWSEITFINSFTNQNFTIREFLLGWLLCTIENQDGFALELAIKGLEKFNDPFFEELKKESIGNMKQKSWRILLDASKCVIKKCLSR